VGELPVNAAGPLPDRPAVIAAGRSRRAGLGRLSIVLVVALASVAGLAPMAAAESPAALVDELNQDGVYVSRVRVDIDEESVEAAIKEVSFTGLRLVAVAPIDPQPNGSAFARRIQEAVDADAAIIFMEDGSLETFVIDDLAPARIRATEKAQAVEDPARAVLVFADELTSERSPGRPAIIGQLIMAVLLMGLVVGLIVGVEQSISATRRRKETSKVTT